MSYMTKTRFEKVTFRPSETARPKTIFMQDVAETTVFGHAAIRGVEIDRAGDEVAPKGVDERIHIIQAEMIVRRTPMIMDNIHGIMVEE